MQGAYALFEGNFIRNELVNLSFRIRYKICSLYRPSWEVVFPKVRIESVDMFDAPITMISLVGFQAYGGALIRAQPLDSKSRNLNLEAIFWIEPIRVVRVWPLAARAGFTSEGSTALPCPMGCNNR